MQIPGPDWKIFKKVRDKALDRFCQRVLNECDNILRDETKTVHERYTTLYGHLRDRDKVIAKAFDDYRRSTAVLCLMLMHQHELLTGEEIEEFSDEVRRSLDLVNKSVDDQ